jgi:single-stranded DNA-specific DHH superfamily exonuclease
MSFKNKKRIKRFKDFISSITKKDRVAVIHHTDPDGVCSGVILSKLVERIRKKKIDFRINQRGNIHYITDDTIKRLKAKKINKVIITDLTVDEHPVGVKKLSEFASVLIIDHHPVYNDLDSKKIVMIKSFFVSDISSSRYCAAKLSYDLANLMVDLSDLDWLAAVGSIGDIATGPFRPWLRKVFRRHRIKLKKDLFKTRLGGVAILISSAESFDVKNVKLCFDIIYKARTYRDVLKSRLRVFRKKIDDELQHYIRNMRSLAEIYPDLDLIYYEMRPKYHTKSPLCTILGIKYPNKTIVTVDLRKGMVSASARRSDSKVAVNKLLSGAVKGFKSANAGGHVFASGANFYKKDYKKFKKRIISLLKKR